MAKNFIITHIIPSDSHCGKLAVVGEETEFAPHRHNPESIHLGDIFAEDEFDKLGHRANCPFHRGRMCDFDPDKRLPPAARNREPLRL